MTEKNVSTVEEGDTLVTSGIIGATKQVGCPGVVFEVQQEQSKTPPKKKGQIKPGEEEKITALMRFLKKETKSLPQVQKNIKDSLWNKRLLPDGVQFIAYDKNKAKLEASVLHQQPAESTLLFKHASFIKQFVSPGANKKKLVTVLSLFDVEYMNDTPQFKELFKKTSEPLLLVAHIIKRGSTFYYPQVGYIKKQLVISLITVEMYFANQASYRIGVRNAS